MDIASVQRVTDQYLDREVTSASGAPRTMTPGRPVPQLNGLLGPGRQPSLTRLTNLSSAFAIGAGADRLRQRTGALTRFQSLATQISIAVEIH